MANSPIATVENKAVNKIKDTGESVKIKCEPKKEKSLKFYTELWADTSHKDMNWQMTIC
jgi:hypothetical protein